MDSWISILLLVLVVVAATAGAYFLRRWIPVERRQRNNEVVGPIIGLVGVIYAVLVAFVTVTVWAKWYDAEAHATQEANQVRGLFHALSAFPDSVSRPIQQDLKHYVEEVIRVEWAIMATGQDTPSIQSALMDDLWRRVQSIQPAGDYQATWYAAVADRMNDLSNARQRRLLSCHAAVPNIMWVFLMVGGIVTIALTLMFGIDSRHAHAAMTAAVAGTIAFLLYLIAALDLPYSGALQVHPEAFQHTLHLISVSLK
ncbi:MAG: DUF4239 domain-containing protein [Armatimonadetes bacterium]|nr:DUF4239 domain-containing protein [Armatimonadota bacterium]